MSGAVTVSLAEALALEWSVLPCGKNKKPIIKKWKPFQTRRATEQELSNWVSRRPMGWAIVTGAISRRITLDFDGQGGRDTLASLAIEPHRKTPSGGFHVDFRHPGWRVSTLNHKTKRELGRRWPGLDIRADGGYVLFTGRIAHGGIRLASRPRTIRSGYPTGGSQGFSGVVKTPRIVHAQDNLDSVASRSPGWAR